MGKLQHIDVFTGTGSTAQQETFRFTSNNNRGLFHSNATPDVLAMGFEPR